MVTNNGEKADTSAGATGNSKKEDRRVVTTPTRKKKIPRSASLPDFQGSILEFEVFTPKPIEEAGTNQNSQGLTTIHGDKKKAALLPPGRLTPSEATPVLSNVRKTISDIHYRAPPMIGNDRGTGNGPGNGINIAPRHSEMDQGRPPSDKRLLKSVSFETEDQRENNPFQNGPQKREDDAYGHYLHTSSFDETPPRQLSPTLARSTLDPNALNTSTSTGRPGDVGTGKLKTEGTQGLQFRPTQGGFASLSIPELSGSKQKLPLKTVTASRHRRHSSFMSEISLESADGDDDDLFDDAFPSEPPHEIFSKTMHLHSNRRVSLTVDMETGKSPVGDSNNFHHGQSAMRRTFSSDMLSAQSPRVRRRRALSHNVSQLRKGFLSNVESLKTKTLNSMPTVKSESDLPAMALSNNSRHGDKLPVIGDIEEGRLAPEDKEEQRVQQSSSASSTSESVRCTDRKRRNRYNVEQKKVMIQNSEESRNYHSEVQYRLSALTPVDLRRRRYKNNLGDTDAETSDKQMEKDLNIKNDDSDDFDISATGGKCGQCCHHFGNFLAEMVLIAISAGKKNISAGLVNKYLYWTFRKNFFIVLLSMACTFYAVTVLFAGFIYLIGVKNPKCIHVNGYDFDETRTRFVDAFALSWTTFSTVGYGLVYPATTATIPDGFNMARECTGIAIITTMEAFVGILFSGIFGAIFFAKVTRVSSFAQVSFSDAVIMKYGTGVTGNVEDAEYAEGSSDEDVLVSPSTYIYQQSKLPVPIMEFRIANRLYRQRGGEIIDAAINIVASMDESKASSSVKNGAGMGSIIRRRGKRAKRARSDKNNKKYQYGNKFASRGFDEENEVNEVNVKRAQEAARNMVLAYTASENKSRRMAPSVPSSLRQDTLRRSNLTPEVPKDETAPEIKESPSKGKMNTKPFPNQIFAKLHVESLEHPFFKRVWTVRHVLAVTSPLLKQEARDLMKMNKGNWPEELNNPTAVRASIHFDQILVSFSGTSNVDANSVYSQKAYNFEDVCVGYSFCNMLFRESDGGIGVDHSLMNDVKEQSGGGGEELDLRGDNESQNRSLRDIFIL